MAKVHLDVNSQQEDLRIITLTNDLLKIQLLPDAGGKIWQITYLPLNTCLLWNNDRVPPAKHAPYLSYDDNWSGGWDELFPNDEEASICGERFPDHGELWSAAWEFETSISETVAQVTLFLHTPISSCLIRKTITLRAGIAQLHVSYSLQNNGDKNMPYLLKLHPAFRVTPAHRIDFPPMLVVREPGFEGTLTDTPHRFPWPCTTRNGVALDLRSVQPSSSRELFFFYGTELKDGWCAITDTSSRLACVLEFDPHFFRSAWMFATYGGWQDYEVAVLEPCTGFPVNFESLMAAGNQYLLKPGESVATEVTLSLHEGIDSVDGVTPDSSATAL